MSYSKTTYEVEYTWAPYGGTYASMARTITKSFDRGGKAFAFRSKCCEAISQQKRKHGCDGDVTEWLEDLLPAAGTLESVSPVLRVGRTAMVQQEAVVSDLHYTWGGVFSAFKRMCELNMGVLKNGETYTWDHTPPFKVEADQSNTRIFVRSPGDFDKTEVLVGDRGQWLAVGPWVSAWPLLVDQLESELAAAEAKRAAERLAETDEAFTWARAQFDVADGA